jgi:hypothetical protein
MALNPRRLLSVLAVVVAASLTRVSAQQPNGGAVALDADDIGGVVTSAKGPEAGVWVVAETTDLPAKFAKIGVTDDQGRYVLPDLPRALVELRDAHAVAPGRRQGDPAEGRQVPDAAESPRQVEADRQASALPYRASSRLHARSASFSL